MRRLGAQGQVAVTALHVGKRDDRDFSTFPARPVRLDAFTRLDVGATVPLPARAGWPATALTLRGENVTNAAYQQIARFAAPGRTLVLGLRLGAP